MSVDRNAANSFRLRRNQQRTRAGDTTAAIKIVPPLQLQTNGIGLNLASAGGIQISSQQLAIKLLDSSLALAAGGLSVNPNTTGGLQISSGLAVKLADTSLQSAAGGLSVKPATNGGITISSGIVVNSFQIVSSDPGSPTAGQAWFNSTSGLAKTNLAAVGGTVLPAALVGVFWTVASGGAVNNTIAKTNLPSGVPIPAGAFNVANRTIRILMVLGGNLVSGNFTLTLNWGSVVMWTQTFTVNPASMWVEMIVQTTATGASGFQQTIGRTSSFNTALNFNTGGATQDLTAAATLQWAVQFSIANASNTLNIAYLTAELLA